MTGPLNLTFIPSSILKYWKLQRYNRKQKTAWGPCGAEAYGSSFRRFYSTMLRIEVYGNRKQFIASTNQNLQGSKLSPSLNRTAYSSWPWGWQLLFIFSFLRDVINVYCAFSAFPSCHKGDTVDFSSYHSIEWDFSIIGAFQQRAWHWTFARIET